MPSWIRGLWCLHRKTTSSAGADPVMEDPTPGPGTSTRERLASTPPMSVDGDDARLPASSRTRRPAAVVRSVLQPAPAVSYLETLPAELRTLILFGLGSVEDLQALVLASPVFYQQYLLDRRALLAHAFRAELGNRVFVDAYAAQASATRYPVGSRRGRTSVTWFLDKYTELRARSVDDDPAVAATAGNPSEADLIRMAAFHLSVVRPLAEEFAAMFLYNLDPALKVGSLSVTEERRLLRALYRFQLFCNLFGPVPRGTPGQPKYGSDDEVQGVFFYGFRPWEIEEVHCIYTLIQDNYTDILEDMQEDMDPNDPKFADPAWGGPIPHPASYDLSSMSE